MKSTMESIIKAIFQNCRQTRLFIENSEQKTAKTKQFSMIFFVFFSFYFTQQYCEFKSFVMLKKFIKRYNMYWYLSSCLKKKMMTIFLFQMKLYFNDSWFSIPFRYDHKSHAKHSFGGTVNYTYYMYVSVCVCMKDDHILYTIYIYVYIY